MAQSMMKTVGVWAFIIGIIIALGVGVASAFLGLSSSLGVISALMVVLGVIVGALNIQDDEVQGFIIAAIGLTSGSIAIANLGPILPSTLGTLVQTTFTVFSVFVAGAVFIPALKAVYKLSRD